MKYTQGCYPIISKTALAKEIYDMTILCPDAAQAAQAGQFINIKVDGFMLRRPISICGIDKEKGTLRIVFEVYYCTTFRRIVQALFQTDVRSASKFGNVTKGGRPWASAFCDVAEF